MKKKYITGKKNKPRLRKVLAMIVLFMLLVGSGVAFIGYRMYVNNLRPVDSSANTEIIVAIPSGSSVVEIGNKLQASKVIRDAGAFKRYVRSQELTDKLQAGTYRFSTNQSVQSITEDLVIGKVAVDLFTILPGYRLGQIRQLFIDDGFEATEVDAALNPRIYADNQALTDKPAGDSLEGYLYPDSFQRTADTTAQTIISASLTEMAQALTPTVRAGIAKQGLSVHEGVIIASIIEREVPSNPANISEDRQRAAQVFLKRIKIGMQLGSDVTALYGAINDKIDLPEDIHEATNIAIGHDSPYNTRIHSGMPPGPISNVSISSLNAVASPSSTDYLFFVAGEDCVTRFSATNSEHEALVAKYGLSTVSKCN